MTKTIVYCDKCGKEIKYPLKSKIDVYKSYSNHRYDLCQACIDEIAQMFINTESNEDGEHMEN